MNEDTYICKYTYSKNNHVSYILQEINLPIKHLGACEINWASFIPPPLRQFIYSYTYIIYIWNIFLIKCRYLTVIHILSIVIWKQSD